MSINKNDDLLNQVAQQMQNSAEGSATAKPGQQDQGTTSTDTLGNQSIGRGSNLLDAAGSKKSDSAATDQAGSAENSKQEMKETSTLDDSIKNADTWTKDSALREVKKLREENRASRIKYEEMVSNFKQEMDSRLKQKETEQEALERKAMELDQLKLQAADKKRSLEEKLSHRETLIAEMKSKLEAEQKTFQQRIDETTQKLASFQAEASAQMEVYQNRLVEEVSSIEVKYRPVADLIIKGAGDAREALVAIQEAKLLGAFEEKRVHVVNNTPGAGDGARANKDKLDAAATAARDGMTPGEKVAAALKNIRSGGSNSAFRGR